MDVSPGRMTVVTGAGAPFGRKVVRSGVALEVPSSKIQFSSVLQAGFTILFLRLCALFPATGRVLRVS